MEIYSFGFVSHGFKGLRIRPKVFSRLLTKAGLPRGNTSMCYSDAGVGVGEGSGAGVGEAAEAGVVSSPA